MSRHTGGRVQPCQSLWQPILIARSLAHAIHNFPLSHAISRTSNIASTSYQASPLRNGRVCFTIKRTTAHIPRTGIVSNAAIS